MLRHVPVRAGQAHSVVGIVGAAAPDLRAAQYPAVAVAHGLGPHAGEIRAGLGIREELREQLLAREDLRDVPLQESRGSVSEHRRRADAEGRAPGDAEVRQHEVPGRLVECSLVRGLEALAAVVDRPGDAGVPGVVEPALEPALGGDPLGGLVRAAAEDR